MKARQDAGGSLLKMASTVTTDASYNQFYNLLIVTPEQKDCYETVNILHYFGFPFNVEEEEYRGQVRKEFGFSKDDQYPLLMIDSSSPDMQAQDQVGKEAILSHLYKLNLIGLYMSHSAYEKVGLRFCEEEFEPALDDIFRQLWPTLQFYSAVKMFRTAKFDQTKPVTALAGQVWKLKKAFGHYLRERKNDSKLSKLEKVARLQALCDDYVKRMDGQEFHGGKIPDAVDFRLFSLLDRVLHTNVIIQMFKAREADIKFELWFRRMSELCARREQF